MKKILLFLISLSFAFTSFGQKKKDILAEINGFYKTIVSNATYDKDEKEVYSAMYSTVLELYPNIIKESESRGYIEAKVEQTAYRSTVNAEILGDKKPYRIVFTLNTEVQNIVYKTNPETQVLEYSYSPFLKSTEFDPKTILKLQTRLYEMLNGQIQLSEALASKIDTYNASQKKEKNKVVKGKDY